MRLAAPLLLLALSPALVSCQQQAHAEDRAQDGWEPGSEPADPVAARQCASLEREGMGRDLALSGKDSRPTLARPGMLAELSPEERPEYLGHRAAIIAARGGFAPKPIAFLRLARPDLSAHQVRVLSRDL